jgi:hypothetical protein
VHKTTLIRRLFGLTVVLALAGGAFVLKWCADSHPVVEQSTEYPSPAGRWQVTMERIDNGLGFGLGVEYYEVHLDKRWTLPWVKVLGRHGDDDRSVVFYVDSERAQPPRVQWTGPRRLRVEYDAGPPEPGKMIGRIDDVEIDYQRRAH